MFNSQGKLDVFENFRVDQQLPKFSKPDAPARPMRVSVVSNTTTNSITSLSTTDAPTIIWSPEFNVAAQQTIRPTPRVEVPSPWWKRMWSRKAKPSMSIEEFFLAIKSSGEAIEIVTERARGYETAIQNAKACGQTALVEQMGHNLVAVRAEAHLAQLGLKKILSEAKLVEFAKKTDRGLRLDWLANFTRPVPEALVKTKMMCDEAGLFDNYAVLHYDPEGKAYSETEAEKAKKKDPILFGLMRGRRVLYYVGDWVDEFCDLTLDKIAGLLGQASIGEI